MTESRLALLAVLDEIEKHDHSMFTAAVADVRGKEPMTDPDDMFSSAATLFLAGLLLVPVVLVAHVLIGVVA